MIKWALVSFVVLVCCAQTSAEVTLKEAKSIKVTFISYQRSEITVKGEIENTNGRLEKPFSVIFDSITYHPDNQPKDVQIGTARLIATSVADVFVFNKLASISFLELVGSGTTNITVIFPDIHNKNKIVSVMTKHLVPVPLFGYQNESTQYFGYAEILE